MENRWPSYAQFPATGEDFERYVGTIFEDLGYGVSLTPKNNDYGVDLLVVEPGTGKRIVVQVKFFNSPSLGNTPIQEVVAGRTFWNATEGWVVTNAQKFSDNAINLANANGIRLFANAELNALAVQARQRVAMGYPVAASVPSIVPRVPTAATQAPSVRTYNYSEVKRRWGCNDRFLRNQMARGLPLHKQPNGRYSITEPELFAWEVAVAKRRKRNKIISLVSGLFLLVVLVCAIVLFLFHSPFMPAAS